MSDTSAAVRIEDISQVKKKLSFDVPWADVRIELDTIYKQVAKTAKIKGFRPGKIPRGILENHYKEQVEGEAISNLVNKYYWDALQEKQIQAVAQPQIEQQGIEKEKDFNFSAMVEVEPVLEPRNYKGLDLEREALAVSDEEVDARLQEIRNMYAVMEDVTEDRGVAERDFVSLDFTGYLDGKTSNELKSENYLLEIGSKSFIPGFEEELLGLKKDENKRFTIKFPDTYHAADIAGKDVEFEVSIKGISTKKLPEYDENFIKNFEGYESLAALRDDIRKNLEEEYQQKITADFEKEISEKLLAENDFEVPDSFVERQIYYMMSDVQRRMISGGMEPKKAAEFAFKMREQFRIEAVKSVKTILLLKSIATKEDLAVTEEELEKRIMEIAAKRRKDYESMKKALEKDEMIENIKSDILTQKTYQFIEENSNVKTLLKNNEVVSEG